MNNKPIYSTHIGAASILLIFMVLSLISFATLTMVNSRSDYILSSKMQERSASYYRACHEGNAFIASSIGNAKPDECFENSIPLGEYQTLDISVTAFPKESENRLPYTINRWRVTTHDENIILDETLPVMK